MSPEAGDRSALRRQMMLLSVVPLVVFLVLFVLVLAQSADRFRVLRDFLTIVDSRAVGGPLRRTINRQFDALLLGQPASDNQTGELIARVIRSREAYDFGRFADVIERQADTAIQAGALLTQARREFDTVQQVSHRTHVALEDALEQLYLAAVQATASFHVEKLPIENAKYAFLHAWDIQLNVARHRRQVLVALREGGMDRDQALAFLQQADRLQQLLKRFDAMARSLDWPRARTFISGYAAPVRAFLGLELLEQLREQVAPRAISQGRARLPATSPTGSGAASWYEAQMPLEQQWESEFLGGLTEAQAQARGVVLREGLFYLSLLLFLLAAIAFAWRKGRTFGRTLVADVQNLRTTLDQVSTENELLLDTDARSTSEIREIFQAVNELIGKLRSHDRQIRSLLAASREREQVLARQAEEIEATNEELHSQALELEQANQQMAAHAAELAQASHYKSEFLANMSHELRTPLNSILVLSRLLAADPDGYLQEDDLDSARVIHEAGSALLALINNILDLSKVEAGKMEISVEPCRLRDLGEALHRRYLPIAQAQSLELHAHFDKRLPEVIVTDPRMVEQIITNLISNALKFTRRGGVYVEYSWHAADRSVSISVRDTGIGIPKEKQARVFNAFEQADGSVSREFGGTGLGLSLAKKMTELLAGTLLLESEAGNGSTFTLRIPADRQAEPARHPVQRVRRPLSAPVADAG